MDTEHPVILKKNTGFTLVEVLVALVLLSVGVTGWVMTQSSNIRSRDLSGALATAQELARSEIEDLITTAHGRDVSDGSFSSQKIYVFPTMTYTVSSTLNATLMDSDGNAVWLVRATSSFERYGSRSVSLERMVVAR